MAVNKVEINGATALDLTGDTVTAGTLKKGITAHDKSGAQITGTLDVPASVAQATPTISVSSSGLITASATQSAGIVSAGTKSATKQLTTQAAKTVTPSTSNQTAVQRGRYTTGAVTVKGDSNLKAENIKKGTSIFGVTGTLDSGGSGGGNRETWVFNKNVVALNPGYQFDIEFESNGMRFTGILGNEDAPITSGEYPLLYLGASPQQVGYVTSDGDAYFDAVWRKITIADTTSEGYEILAERVLNEINIDHEPNAVKQPSDVAVQTDKALTITSNGTTDITPDVPYDAMSKVAVTVNVPGVAEEATVTIVKNDEWSPRPNSTIGIYYLAPDGSLSALSIYSNSLPTSDIILSVRKNTIIAVQDINFLLGYKQNITGGEFIGKNTFIAPGFLVTDSSCVITPVSDQ